MALQDVIPVLQGFSGAYERLADTENSNITHHIKLSAVQQGSADIVLEVRHWLTDNSETIVAVAGLTTIGGAMAIAFPIVNKIFEVIGIKKHVGADASKERISAENSIVVSNSNNVEITVSPRAYELYKNGTLDEDLERLTRPLQEGRINSAEFEVQADNQETLSQRITSEDRPHFEIKDPEVTTTIKETEIVATLNSLTKSTNSGYLHLQNGKRIFYRYLGDDNSKLHTIFGNYNGPVKIRCRAKLDDQLDVVSVDVLKIDRMQMEMF